jgi:hypothetical protein
LDTPWRRPADARTLSPHCRPLCPPSVVSATEEGRSRSTTSGVRKVTEGYGRLRKVTEGYFATAAARGRPRPSSISPLALCALRPVAILVCFFASVTSVATLANIGPNRLSKHDKTHHCHRSKNAKTPVNIDLSPMSPMSPVKSPSGGRSPTSPGTLSAHFVGHFVHPP